MSNSTLVDCTVHSPNHSGKRTHTLDTLTPHCVVGQLSAERIGACFPKGREASCNYGIGYDGRVCLIVDESNRSWCTSSNANDQRAITIECASDKTEPYTMNAAVYEKLILLCADICKRNGKNKVLWLGSKEKTLAYEPKSNEMVLTAHRWFANKSCPGEWLYSRYGELANRINALLDTGNTEAEKKPASSGSALYYVQSGAFSKKANADAQAKKIKAAGFDVLVKKEGNLYKVQTGAYSKKANAEAQAKQLKAKGFDAFVTTNGGTAASGAAESFKVGDKVKCNNGVTKFSNGSRMASWVPSSVLYVRKVQNGGKILLVSTEPTKAVYTGLVNAADVHKI